MSACEARSMTASSSSRLSARYSGPPPSASRWLTIATPRAGTGPCSARQPASPASSPADLAIRSRRSGTCGWRAAPADREAASSRGRASGDTAATRTRRRLAARLRRYSIEVRTMARAARTALASGRAPSARSRSRRAASPRASIRCQGRSRRTVRRPKSSSTRICISCHLPRVTGNSSILVTSVTCKVFYLVMRGLVIMTASLVSMPLPSWASHLEHKLAPPPLLLVQAFVNTLDLELHTDVLAHADEARAWLADAGLRDPEEPDLAADLQLARDVRESLRAMIARNTGGPPLTEAELRPLEEVTSEFSPRLMVAADGGVRFGTREAAPCLSDGLAGLVLAVRDAQA